MTAASAKVSQPKDYKLIVEKDVWIPLRDGSLICADIFRPDGGAERFAKMGGAEHIHDQSRRTGHDHGGPHALQCARCDQPGHIGRQAAKKRSQ